MTRQAPAAGRQTAAAARTMRSTRVYNEFKNSFFEFIELAMHLNRH
jgi:hypothetical protein